jgi:hypothetical protein
MYLDPPQHAVAFCIDEKTAIPALDRLDPVLAERHGFEYYRHGTLSLYVALNTRTGEWWATPRLVTRVQNSSASCRPLSTRSPDGARCTSSWTISRPTKRSRSGASWRRIRPFIFFITGRPIRPGSIKSNSGSKIERDVTARGAISALQQDSDDHPLVLHGPGAENRMTAVQLESTVH